MKKISTRAPFVIIEDLHIKTRAESKRAQFNYFPVENSNHRKKLSTFNDNKISRICVILWEAVEDVTVMFTYFIALPLLPKNLTQNFDQLNRTFHVEIRLVDNFKLLKIELSVKIHLSVRMSVCLCSAERRESE